MTEPEEGTGIDLHPETLRRIEDVFGKESCYVCGLPAVRLYGGRFFCAQHYLKGKTPSTPPRVYRCTITRPD